ncbi:MAG: hypothetical protein A4E35_02462 [Methanoregula sp. PtaU1.Bin051]|nr:MAG: hypothetical protein A4E35_02462 [Methanoregula sp. PtaU1.Bin051]
MQKEDIQWAVLGILILLVIALVIKPMATGQPVNLGLPEKATPSPLISQVQTPLPEAIPTTPVDVATTESITPTPTPTWDQQVQNVQFVDPSTYGVNLNQSLPNYTKIATDNASLRGSMTTYATFSGQYSGTTQIIKIPFPYWELWYTVEPRSTDLAQQAEPGGQYVVTPTQGIGEAKSGFSGSYSTALPSFSIQIIDGEDPNRIVRSISPTGSLDPKLWSKDDPRPWKEKVFEGQRSYYFIIKSSLLESYTIDIKIPSSYIGKY